MKIKIWFFIALFPILLMGCTGGSYSIRIGELTTSANSISGEYTSFSGYFFKEVPFKKGDVIHFHYSVSTTKGKFSAKLLDSSGTVIKKITKDQTIYISKKDRYKIRVEGKKHHGSFYLSWSKEKV